MGFSKDNNAFVYETLTNTTSDNDSDKCRRYNKTDSRGTKEKPKINRDIITAHVEMFHPSVSHYRREHAPNKRYLPSDITLKFMHNHFNEIHPDIKCGYDTYRQHVVDKMNISFTKLGHEECEMCEVFKLHDRMHTKENLVP